MSLILAIDPGTTHSGWVTLRNGLPWNADVIPNAEVLDRLRVMQGQVAIEMTAMP